MASATLIKLLPRALKSFNALFATLDTFILYGNDIHNSFSLDKVTLAPYHVHTCDVSDQDGDTQRVEHRRDEEGTKENGGTHNGGIFGLAHS